jgi:hypothetical protein
MSRYQAIIDKNPRCVVIGSFIVNGISKVCKELILAGIDIFFIA